MSQQQHPREVARRARMAYLVAKAIEGLGSEIRVIVDPGHDLGNEEPTQVRADFTVQYLDVRVPLLLLLDLKDESGFFESSTLQLAWPILRRSPETLAVALVANNEQLSTAIIEPPDSVGAISVPSGESIGPSLRHRIAPLADALQRFFDSMVPQWETVGSVADTEGVVDSRAISRNVGLSIATEIQEEGARARIEQKVRSFGAIGEQDVDWAVSQVVRLLAGEEFSLSESVNSQAEQAT